eukprot:scaffold701_cov58-Cylindrotheca_fusiformis.AAC.3
MVGMKQRGVMHQSIESILLGGSRSNPPPANLPAGLVHKYASWRQQKMTAFDLVVVTMALVYDIFYAM